MAVGGAAPSRRTASDFAVGVEEQVSMSFDSPWCASSTALISTSSSFVRCPTTRSVGRRSRWNQPSGSRLPRGRYRPSRGAVWGRTCRHYRIFAFVVSSWSCACRRADVSLGARGAILRIVVVARVPAGLCLAWCMRRHSTFRLVVRVCACGVHAHVSFA